MSNLIKSLYIHIPFCVAKCPYCDFFSLSSINKETKDIYTIAMLQEFSSVSKDLSKKMDSIYVGGGTPLELGLSNIKRLFSKITEHCSYTTEFTIELNPAKTVVEIKDLLQLFKCFGINRASLGIQTTNKEIAHHIKREINISLVEKLCESLKKNKISISLDFMFGLPYQTLENLKDDLEFIKKLEPEHISMYLFTVPESYKLASKIPNEHQIIEMFNITSAGLKKLGYIHYEVSNYAKHGFESIHNSNYWNRGSYIGMGAGAHSFYCSKNTRYWHKDNITEYIKNPLLKELESIDDEQVYTETIMLGLRMLKNGINKKILKNNKYLDFIDSGYLKIDKDNNITVTTRGLPILDNITKKLLY